MIQSKRVNKGKLKESLLFEGGDGSNLNANALAKFNKASRTNINDSDGDDYGGPPLEKK